MIYFLKLFFGKQGNERFLKSFLEELLEIKIEKIEIITEYTLEQLAKEEKGGRLDLEAKINNEIIVNIELQIRNQKDIEKRTLYYAARLITENSKTGEQYERLKQIIMINILDYELLEFKEYISDTVTVINKHREYETIKNQKFYYIELPKFRKAKIDINDKLNQWIALIDDDKEMVEMAITKNKTIKEAKEEVDKLTADPNLRGILKLRDKWERDYYNDIGCAKDEGREEGERIGRNEGEKIGREEEKQEAAIAMFKLEMDMNNIMKVTKLTKKELEKIKKKYNL